MSSPLTDAFRETRLLSGSADTLWRSDAHKIFRRKYSTKRVSTKRTFDKMTLRQKAFSRNDPVDNVSFDEVSYIGSDCFHRKWSSYIARKK